MYMFIFDIVLNYKEQNILEVQIKDKLLEIL